MWLNCFPENSVHHSVDQKEWEESFCKFERYDTQSYSEERFEDNVERRVYQQLKAQKMMTTLRN